MKVIIKMTTILMLASIMGCGKENKPDKPADTGVFKSQLKTLEQAKQVEQGLKDAAEQQRQKIEKETQ